MTKQIVTVGNVFQTTAGYVEQTSPRVWAAYDVANNLLGMIQGRANAEEIVRSRFLDAFS